MKLTAVTSWSDASSLPVFPHPHPTNTVIRSGLRPPRLFPFALTTTCCPLPCSPRTLPPLFQYGDFISHRVTYRTTGTGTYYFPTVNRAFYIFTNFMDLSISRLPCLSQRTPKSDACSFISQSFTYSSFGLQPFGGFRIIKSTDLIACLQLDGKLFPVNSDMSF